PALDMAASGFPISWGLARSLRSKATAEKLGKFPESKRIFLNDGKFYEVGDTLLQPDLAWTLDRIRANGADGFYTGETASKLATDMKAHGGLITLEDLRDYKAIEREPLNGSYHG